MAGDPRQATTLIRRMADHSADISRRASALAAAAKSSDERLITRSKEAIANSRDHLGKLPPSPARRKEFADLSLSDTHIDLARGHIRRQRDLIERLSRRGIPTDMAELLLETLENTLRALEGHRTLIRNRLDV